MNTKPIQTPPGLGDLANAKIVTANTLEAKPVKEGPQDAKTSDGKEGEFENHTYLYIRTHPQDTGAEPLAQGLEGWISPDINIVHADSTLDTTTTVNEAVNVRVIVTNAGGIDAYGAVLEVYIADPSTSFTPGFATLIGTVSLDVQGYSSTSVDLPWQATQANAGHRCLAARVALYTPPDRFRDPQIFDVYGDRHVAQRNIHVAAAPAAGGTVNFGFRVSGSPLAKSGRFIVALREIDGKKKKEILPLGLKGNIATQLLGSTGLVVDPRRFVANAKEHADRKKLPSVGLVPEAPKAAESARSIRLDLKPDEVATVYLQATLPAESRPGDLHVIEIVQINAETKAPIGGLSVIIQHPF